MPFIPIHIIDDRGQRVPLFRLGILRQFAPHAIRPGTCGVAAKRTSVQRAETAIARINARASVWGFSWQRAAVMLLALLTVATTVLAMSRLVDTGTMPIVLAVPLCWAAGAVLMQPLRWMLERLNAPRVRAALLAERLCASCAYDLANSPRDPDGLTPCPECGAAWRV